MDGPSAPSGGHKRQVIHAMLKGQVVLPCNLEPPEPGDAVSLVLWYKDKSMVPIFSVDARSAPVEEARHKPGPWLEGRALLKISAAAKSTQRTRRQATLAAAPLAALGAQRLPANSTGDGAEVGRAWRRRRRRRAHNKNHASQESELLGQSLAPLGSSWAPPAAGLPFAAVQRRQAWQSSGAGDDSPEAGREEPDASAGPESEQKPQLEPGLPALPSPLGLAAAGGALGASSQPEQLIAQLHIDSLSSEDNGLYLCRVDFRKARSRTQEALLKIIVPADRPTIRDATGRGGREELGAPPAPSLVVGPHNEGAKVVLECETQGGYPEPALTWWRDGRLIDDSYEIVAAADGQLVARHADELAAPAPPGEEAAPAGGLQVGEESGAEPAESGDPPTGGSEAAGPGSAGAPDAEQPPKQVTQNRLIRNRLELASLARDDLLANYSCQAWNTKLSEPPTASVMIDMNLRPIKVQIDNERQPVLADKPLEIVCRAFGSRPAALISWWRGDTRLAAGSLQHRHTHHRSSQPRPPLLPSDSGGVEGSLEDGAGGAARGGGGNQVQVQIEESVSSDSNVTSSTLTIVPRLDDGGQIITCKAENPKLSASSAASGGQPTGSLEDSWKLDVHYAPRASLALGEKLNGQIREGHDVYFECSVKAHPQAHEVRWWFEGRELETNLSSGVIISNQSLVLQRVSRHQRGRYTCSAINSVGESHSNSLHLRVQYAPFCRDSPSSGHKPPAAGGEQQQRQQPSTTAVDSPLVAAEGGPFGALSQQRFKLNYGAARLESVKVYCHVDADPAESVAYKWAFVSANGKQQPALAPSGLAARSSGKQQQQQLVYLDAGSVSSLAPDDPLSSVATYTPRSELDYGSLLCWASNALGEQTEPCVYQVVPAERPDPMRNCRLLNASDTQLMVGCEPGYDGGVDQSFQMEVYDTGKRELVANVSSAPVLSGADGAPGGYSSGGVVNLLDLNLNETQSNTPTYQDDPAAGGRVGDAGDGGEDDSSGAGRAQPAPSAGGQQPASLVSEPVGAASRQQKQRHSNSAGNNNGKQRAASSPHQQQHHQHRPQRTQTVFITEPNLRPATDYFLSIYSANSKGSSKPVAFTATTLNPAAGSGVGGADFALPARDGRRSAGSSHLLSDVLALSWNPFLLVCAATLGLFVVFASITFAMMKYVDFSAGAGPDAASADASPAGSSGSTTKIGAQQQCVSASQTGQPADNGNAPGDDDAESEAGRGRHRARIITLADNSTVSGKEHHIPLNGMHQRARSSLLDGTYLRSKLQQLAGQSPLRGAALKQSNSDHFLDQLGARGVAGGCRTSAGQPRQQSQQQYHQQQARLRLAQLQQRHLAGALCGTLPKSPAEFQQRLAWCQQAQQQQQQPVQMHEFESPYGAKAPSVATGSPSIEDGTSASYSAATSTSGALQHQSLVLAGPIGEPRVEQLIISGKQYIHQTSPSYQHQQQRQLAQQQRHLQLTSCAALPAAGNLYSMKDYQASLQQQQQLARRPLVCIDHQTQLAAGGDQQQLDAPACLGGACLAIAGSPGSSAPAEAAQSGLSYARHQQQQQLYVDSHAIMLGAAQGGFVCNREQVTSENFSPPMVADRQLANHNSNKTSDLGSDEMGTNEFDAESLLGRTSSQQQLAGAGCHVAHLTLVDGGAHSDSGAAQLEQLLTNAGAGSGLDSDGLSSSNGGGYSLGRAQLATLGSPSSGAGDLYEQHTANNHSSSQRTTNASQHQHHHQYLGQQQGSAGSSQTTQAGSTSTITSGEHQQQHDQQTAGLEGGGNLIGVLNQQQQALTGADHELSGRMFAQSALRNPKQAHTAQVVGTSGLRQAKKSFHPNGKTNCEFVQQPPDFNERQSQLEQQYTMYVAEASIADSILQNDINNNGCQSNLGEFYLLTAQTNNIGGSHVDVGKTRVRLIGGGGVGDRAGESDLHTDV